jgi:lysophospholipase L1-like esterase
VKSIALALLSAPLMFSVSLFAQQDAAATPQAIDPIYTTTPSSLTPEQVANLQKKGADWPQLARYRDANAALAAPKPGEKRVVFYGDSITDNWGQYVKEAPFFPGKPYLNRGISGQTTPQMVVRFQQDVIHLKPAVVVILAGTNDLAGNSGLSTMEMIEDNLTSMAELAKANGIKVVFASVLPVSDYPWRRGLQPADKVKALNAWEKRYAGSHGMVYLDYYSAMVNAQGGLDAVLATDGVHPTVAGYAMMTPLAEKSIAEALKR